MPPLHHHVRRQGGITVYQHPTPDERANAAEDDVELVNAERCGRGCHALRVVQRSVLLMGAPQYLARSACWVRVYYGSPPGCVSAVAVSCCC
jgi:hypothetical protein